MKQTLTQKLGLLGVLSFFFLRGGGRACAAGVPGV